MSFSGEIREELAAQTTAAAHCRAAELTAVILMCGAVSISVFDRPVLRIQTENVHVVRAFFRLVRKLAHVTPQVGIRRKRLQGSRSGTDGAQEEQRVRMTYVAAVTDPGKAQEILDLCHIPDEPRRSVQKDCCKRAYLRGAFLVSGSVSDPKKSYHLEIVCANREQADFALDIMRSIGLDARMVLRKEKFMVYLKEADQISDMLGLMGSTKALLKFENVRILREISGSVNRQVNCETANISKTVDAAVRQIEDIRFVAQRMGLEKLPENLREAAAVRLENPDVPLKRLGELMDPPIGKSGMNHRLANISRIAQEMREKEGR